MHAEWLQQQLRAKGIKVLAVTRDAVIPDLFVITLHGNAGQNDGTALRVCRQMQGVRVVAESRVTKSILLVRTDPKFPAPQPDPRSGRLSSRSSDPHSSACGRT